jgi:predicted enzyme related to lactoylglutathione lyase
VVAVRRGHRVLAVAEAGDGELHGQRSRRVDDKIEDLEFGRFGWAMDPEGNRFELWQPTQLPS